MQIDILIEIDIALFWHIILYIMYDIQFQSALKVFIIQK